MFTPRFSLLVAVVVGTIASLLVRTVVVSNSESARQEKISNTIVVARGPIAFGAPLTIENMEEVPWKSAHPLDGGFAKVSDVLKDGRRLALVSLQRTEPILLSRVTAPNQRATLSTQLDDGMRAVTIRVDEVRGVAGFILPGDRVDVISTRGGEGAQDSAAYADVLLQNIKVLAVDQLADERQDKPTIARAVTLGLTVVQAQKVVLAGDIGRLSLVLRQANAADADATVRVTVGDLGGAANTSGNKVTDLETSIANMKASVEAAKEQSERVMAQKLAEIEARLKARPMEPAQPFGATPIETVKLGSVINVIRNGSKTETYTVSSEH